VKGTAHLPLSAQLIDVADQGAGTFEFLEHELKSRRRFVIRDGKVRKVYAGHSRQGRQQYLRKYAQSLSELGRFTMDVQAQKGRKARMEAEFVVRGGAVLVLPPHARYGHHGREPLPLYVVCVSEVKPPPRRKADRVVAADQRTRANPGRRSARGRVVRAALDHRGVSQRDEDRLRH
jgi:hypothetical protein